MYPLSCTALRFLQGLQSLEGRRVHVIFLADKATMPRKRALKMLQNKKLAQSAGKSGMLRFGQSHNMQLVPRVASHANEHRHRQERDRPLMDPTAASTGTHVQLTSRACTRDATTATY